eukprot:TRINITY_DN4_c0_g2_i3.p1 TRINITY_DN4_c0_g2~~TRINITY_DN4_c0_g2_i3.p1  ORF type:complete len:414 (-),score=102.88 TRINITY_DN4_c0_g2_i3:13-1218(-)
MGEPAAAAAATSASAVAAVTAAPPTDATNTSPHTSAVRCRFLRFEEAVTKEVLAPSDIRELAFSGVPDKLRAVYWKILLNYLPHNRSGWDEVLQSSRKQYADWRRELFQDPHEKLASCDHPLSMASNSAWNCYFKDQALMDEINKDVTRTFPDLHFYSGKSGTNTIHYEGLRHALFIFAKLNPGIRYVQGMNEIIAPLYYVFATSESAECVENAEADTFFCFTNLMSEIRDHFIKTLDTSDLGVTHTIFKLDGLLKRLDPQLWQNLHAKQIHPQFYGFRWITLLMSQEFTLPDTLRLWDSFFSDSHRFHFLLFFCCAMILHAKEKLLVGSFGDNIYLLQHYAAQVDVDPTFLLAKAAELQKAVPPGLLDSSELVETPTDRVELDLKETDADIRRVRLCVFN